MTKRLGWIMLRIIIFYNGSAGARAVGTAAGGTETTGGSPQEYRVVDNFVVLEGLDGAGTTTQLRLVDERLTAAGIPHFCTGEPTSGIVGRLVRAILKQEVRVEPRTVALLFAADRSEHLHEPQEGILARVGRGELVISDRYLFSSLAYQSLGCPFSYVQELNRAFPLPRLILFIDTPVPVSQERLIRRRAVVPGSGAASTAGESSPSSDSTAAAGAAASGELFDGFELQHDILAAYERAFALFDRTPMEVHRVDGSASTDEVFENIWKILQRLPILRG